MSPSAGSRILDSGAPRQNDTPRADDRKAGPMAADPPGRSRPASALRRRGVRRLSAITAAVAIVSAAASGTIAAALPGSAHGAAHGKAATGQDRSTGSTGTSGAGTSGTGTSSASSARPGAASVAPASSSGGTHATSGGS